MCVRKYDKKDNQHPCMSCRHLPWTNYSINTKHRAPHMCRSGWNALGYMDGRWHHSGIGGNILEGPLFYQGLVRRGRHLIGLLAHYKMWSIETKILGLDFRSIASWSQSVLDGDPREEVGQVRLAKDGAQVARIEDPGNRGEVENRRVTCLGLRAAATGNVIKNTYDQRCGIISTRHIWCLLELIHHRGPHGHETHGS